MILSKFKIKLKNNLTKDSCIEVFADIWNDDVDRSILDLHVILEITNLKVKNI